MARTVERMLDALGYDRVDVLGVSLGGVVAQQLAHQAPDRVRRLVLAATGPGLGGVPGSPRVLLALATPRRYYQPDYYRRIAGRIYGGAGPPRPRRAAARLGGPLRPTRRRCAATSASSTPSAAGPACRGCAGCRSRPWSSPATTTRSCRSSTAASWPGCIPDARLHVVPGGGHLFLLERPAETAALVADFLTTESPTAAPSGARGGEGGRGGAGNGGQ